MTARFGRSSFWLYVIKLHSLRQPVSAQLSDKAVDMGSGKTARDAGQKLVLRVK